MDICYVLSSHSLLSVPWPTSGYARPAATVSRPLAAASVRGGSRRDQCEIGYVEYTDLFSGSAKRDIRESRVLMLVMMT